MRQLIRFTNQTFDEPSQIYSKNSWNFSLSQDFELKLQCGHDAVNGHKTIKVVFWLAPNSIDFIGWEIC